MLETQNNLVREVQEAMSAMNTIIKNTREEMMATTNSSQLLMTENMRNLTKALETIKDNLLGRIGSLDGNLGDLNKRLDLTNEAFNESAIRLTQTMETEFGRVDKVMDRVEQEPQRQDQPQRREAAAVAVGVRGQEPQCLQRNEQHAKVPQKANPQSQ